MPPGPKGEDGKSAYQVWVDQVNAGTIAWPKGEVAVVDFFRYLKGKDGVNGKDGLSAYDQWVAYISSGTVANPHKPSEAWPKTTNTMADFWYFLSGSTGENGKTPHIGADGNWWIGTSNTGVPARGEKGDKGADGQNGKDGLTPAIGPDGNWWIGTTSLGVPARGKDGKDAPAPTIVANPDGNWWVNGVNTGKSWKGEKGDRGTDAVAPVVTIGINDNWFINGKDTGHPSRGKDGENGKDAASATVKAGDNGNWFISTDGGKTWEDTGKPWKGKDGISPEVVIGPNKNWWINGKDSGHPAYGKDGSTPYIGSNGNWWVNIDGVDKDLKVPATGPKGDKGDQGVTGETPHIGSNGNWWVRINGVDTDLGVPATGPKGDTGATGPKGDTGATGPQGPAGPQGPQGPQGPAGTNGTNGINGKSAYQLWVEEVEKGTLTNPHDPLKTWPTTKTSIENFWEYLRGRDGGSVTYKDGEPTVAVVPNKYNVLPVLYNGENKEYQKPHDGSVRMKVYGKDGAVVPAGVVVSNIPGVTPGRTYTTDAEGLITIPREDLPDHNTVADEARRGTPTVNGEVGAPNTVTPYRVVTRLVATHVYLGDRWNYVLPYEHHTTHVTVIKYKYERFINGAWSPYPTANQTTTGTEEELAKLSYPPAKILTVKVTNPAAKPVTDTDVVVDEAFDKKWRMTDGRAFADDLKILGSASTIITVVRPAVLRPWEDGVDPATITLSSYKTYLSTAQQYKWDNTDMYITLKGMNYFYGDTPVMDAVIHNPEIYPAPAVKDVKLYISGTSTYLWGKLDLDNWNPFYYRHEIPTPGSNKWLSVQKTGTALQTEELFTKTASVPRFFVGGTKNLGTGVGNTYTERRMDSEKTGADKWNFIVDSTYPDNYFGATIRLHDNYGTLTYGKLDKENYKGAYLMPYRGVPQFRLMKTGGTYRLEVPFSSTVTTGIGGVPYDLPQAPIPADWVK